MHPTAKTALAALLACLTFASAQAGVILDERSAGDDTDANLEGNYLAGQASHDYRVVGEFSNDAIARWILEFTLDAAAQAQIAAAEKVELVLAVQDGGWQTDIIDVVALDGTGTGENGVADKSDWEAGAAFVQTLNPSGDAIADDATFTIDVTDIVKADAASGFTGFRVEQQNDTARADHLGDNNTVKFWSLNAADADDRPRLVITPVPEPGSAALGLLGAGLLLFRRR